MGINRPRFSSNFTGITDSDLRDNRSGYSSDLREQEFCTSGRKSLV